MAWQPSRPIALEALLGTLALAPELLQSYRASLDRSSLSFRCTEHYASLIASLPEPSRSQLLHVVVPPLGAAAFSGRFDPYGNTAARRWEPYLQHKYCETLLVHLTNACAGHCQGCYKVQELSFPTSFSITSILATTRSYLALHPEIDNVLLSGGDPGLLPTKMLAMVFEKLSAAGVPLVRLATKELAFDPARFLDQELLTLLSSLPMRPVVIAHYSHPAEFSSTSRAALQALRSAGVQVYGQPFLQRGVNDDSLVLRDLFSTMVENGVVPYYLSAFMPVRGVEQYALPLREAMSLVTQARRHLNGLAKKCVFIAPHDWGKFELLGVDEEFLYGRWHQRAMDAPAVFGAEEVLRLHCSSTVYCLDHLFAENNLPHIALARQ